MNPYTDTAGMEEYDLGPMSPDSAIHLADGEPKALFPDTLFAVAPNGLTMLIHGCAELALLMDGCMFDDNCMGDLRKRDDWPHDPGVYRGTVEYWFYQGYNEDGYKADGESDFDFSVRDIKKLDLR